MLLGFHERFWHAPPQDMLRLLQAMILPKDIVAMGSSNPDLASKWSDEIPDAKNIDDLHDSGAFIRLDNMINVGLTKTLTGNIFQK